MLALAGQLFGGWSSDHFQERRLHACLPIVIGAIAIGCAPFTQGNLPLTIICFMVAFAGFKTYMPAFWSLPSLFLTQAAAAGSIGLINSIGNLGGFFGPNIMGWVRTTTGSFSGALYFLCGSMLISETRTTCPQIMTKRRLLWLLLLPLLLLLFGGYRLRLETDILATLPGDLPEVQALKLLHNAFTGSNDLLIALEASDDTVAGSMIPALADHLSKRTDLVKEVHWAQPLERQAESGAALLAWALQNADPAKLKAWQKSVEGPAVSARLKQSLNTIATAFDAEKVQRASYDPLGLMDCLDTS
eukprot:gene49082-60081_t